MSGKRGHIFFKLFYGLGSVVSAALEKSRFSREEKAFFAVQFYETLRQGGKTLPGDEATETARKISSRSSFSVAC